MNKIESLIYSVFGKYDATTNWEYLLENGTIDSLKSELDIKNTKPGFFYIWENYFDNHYVAECNYFKIINWALNNISKPNSTDSDGNTILHLLGSYYSKNKLKNKEINQHIFWFLQLGTNPELKNNDGLTCVDIANMNTKDFNMLIDWNVCEECYTMIGKPLDFFSCDGCNRLIWIDGELDEVFDNIEFIFD